MGQQFLAADQGSPNPAPGTVLWRACDNIVNYFNKLKFIIENDPKWNSAKSGARLYAYFPWKEPL